VITSIEQWVAFLQRSDTLLGVPLCAVGFMLAIAGWRLWKAAVVVTFGIIGGVIGVLVAGSEHESLTYCIVGAVLLGAASLPPANYSIAVLGGLISAAIAHTTLTELNLPAWATWIAMGVIFAACTALSFIYLRPVIAIITAFEGAVLLLSGAAVFISDMPSLWSFFRSISVNYAFFLPFLLLVPTIAGSLLQMADAKQRDSGMATG
jgi:hypothetical protein